MSAGFCNSTEEPPAEPLYSAAVDAVFEGRQIGEGSYGSVFACRPRSAEDVRPTGDAQHVIKIVALHGKSSSRALTSREVRLNLELRQEIEIMQLLAPHRSFIPALLAHEECHLLGAGHLRMLFVREHSTLHQVLNLQGTDGGTVGMDEGTARFYIACIVEGLSCAHSLGVTHRDLKPDNVLISEDGYCKLGDWGCARVLDRDSVQKAVGAEPSDICADAYRAPELWRALLSEAQRRPQNRVSMPYGRDIDLWSLGIVCFELVTARDLLLDSPRTQLELEAEAGEKMQHAGSEYRRSLNEMRAYIQAGGLLQHASSRPNKLWAQRLNSSTEAARSLLCGLMAVQPSERLGMSVGSVAAGFDELRASSWFADFDWEGLRARSMVPPKVFSIDHSNDWVRTDPDLEVSGSSRSASADAGLAAIDASGLPTMAPSKTKWPKRRSEPFSPSDLDLAAPQKRLRRQVIVPGMVDSGPRRLSLAKPPK